jgi:hypothetical protein
MTTLSNTVAPRRWFPVSSGLLTWKHYQRLGPTLMLFLWMIHEERKPRCAKNDDGAVRNGQPISYEDIRISFQGMPVKTIERHIATLETEGYIRSEYVRGRGKRYWISKPIRWSILLPKNEGSSKVRGSDSSEMRSPTPQKWGAVPLKNEEANKEQEPTTTRTLKTLRADARLLPEWVPPDSWAAFVEMRRKSRAPLTDEAIDLTLQTLAKLRAEGQNVQQVLNQSVQRSWRGVFPVKGSHDHVNKAEQRQASNLAAAAAAKRALGLVS